MRHQVSIIQNRSRVCPRLFVRCGRCVSQYNRSNPFNSLARQANVRDAISVPVMIQPGLTILADQFQVSPDTVSSLAIGSLAFWTAVASFFVVSASVVWGKRPFYVASTLVLTISNLIAYKSDVRKTRKCLSTASLC